MDPEGSLPCSQDPTSVPCPLPDLYIHLLSILSITFTQRIPTAVFAEKWESLQDTM